MLLSATYPAAVARAGGEPVLLPTGTADPDVVARLDGLVLAGGPDVDPARYGQPVGPHTGTPRTDRDGTEAGLLTAALPGSPVAALVGDRVGAHCHHHQAVGRLAPSLRVTATAEDGTVEAVDRDGDAFCLGVQWHPRPAPTAGCSSAGHRGRGPG